MIDTLKSYAQVQIVNCDDFTTVLPQLASTGKVLLVTSKGFTARGVVEQVLDALGAPRVEVFDDVSPNPEKLHLQQQVGQFKQAQIEHVVALGGGSCIDAAKIFCALLSHQNSTLDELLTQNQVSNKVNLIAVPTTSGTGAEVTPFATVWDTAKNKKFSLYGILPSSAVLSPSLTVTLPAKTTLYPALDALSHALESLWNHNTTAETARYAHQAIEAICEYLPVVLKQPSNLAARQHLQQAATLAGMAIATAKTALAHAMSYPLTAKFGVPHGLACSFTLNAIIRELGHQALKLDKNTADKVTQLLESIDFDSELQNYVNWEDIQELAELNFDKSRTGNFLQPVDNRLVAKILRKSQQLAQSKR